MQEQTKPEEEQTVNVTFNQKALELKDEVDYKFVNGTLWLFIKGKWISTAHTH